MENVNTVVEYLKKLDIPLCFLNSEQEVKNPPEIRKKVGKSVAEVCKVWLN